MKRAQAEPVSERRRKVETEATEGRDEVRRLRDDALDILNNLRTEAAQLHWYAHQFVIGKAGITKDGVLIQFGETASDIGMSLNMLADSVDRLAAMVESEAAK